MEKILINAVDITYAVLLVCCVFCGQRLFLMLVPCFSFFVIIGDGYDIMM
jgi:hypothetical protein